VAYLFERRQNTCLIAGSELASRSMAPSVQRTYELRAPLATSVRSSAELPCLTRPSPTTVILTRGRFVRLSVTPRRSSRQCLINGGYSTDGPWSFAVRRNGGLCRLWAVPSTLDGSLEALDRAARGDDAEFEMTVVGLGLANTVTPPKSEPTLPRKHAAIRPLTTWRHRPCMRARTRLSRKCLTAAQEIMPPGPGGPSLPHPRRGS